MRVIICYLQESASLTQITTLHILAFLFNVEFDEFDMFKIMQCTKYNSDLTKIQYADYINVNNNNFKLFISDRYLEQLGQMPHLRTCYNDAACKRTLIC